MTILVLERLPSPWWLLLVAGCILPGFGEEIFFRGFLSRGLVGRHGVIGGTLIASLLFGLIHVDPVQASGAFLLGRIISTFVTPSNRMLQELVPLVTGYCIT